MVKNILGGLVIMAVAAGIGLARNGMRSRPIKLVQTIKPVSTAIHDKTETDTTNASADGERGAQTLPEGSISAQEMKALVDGGAVVILDARAPSAFAEGHIPGAVNIPYDQLPNYIEKLEMSAAPDEKIVCYCWSPTCDFSDQLATELKLMGYEDVLVFTGGWDHWTAGGYDTEKGSAE